MNTAQKQTALEALDNIVKDILKEFVDTYTKQEVEALTARTLILKYELNDSDYKLFPLAGEGATLLTLPAMKGVTVLAANVNKPCVKCRFGKLEVLICNVRNIGETLGLKTWTQKTRERCVTFTDYT